ncbi:TetR/AcrR family transcriptional regulator [Glycomyces sp. NPDC021274]|uniref:TetR/AcrR family transcriptional regulator n=1 Tax=Glycomyces sp. NPDC021274 TaxID=3155120 RepID=UPI0033D7F98F
MPAQSPDRKPLSAEAIVASAVELADEGGIGSVSMRRIAGRLGCNPMSLYYHVPDKQVLLSLMVDAVMRLHHYPDPGSRSWRERLHTAARLDWDMYMAHPWLLDTVATTRPPFGPETLAAAEWFLDALALIELPLSACGLAISTINHYVQGSARVALSGSERAEGGSEDVGRVWQSRLADADLAAFPRLQALVATESVSQEQSRFTDGLDLILDGIALHSPSETRSN